MDEDIGGHDAASCPPISGEKRMKTGKVALKEQARKLKKQKARKKRRKR